MYHIIKQMHSGWAYLALLLLFIAALTTLMGYFTKKEFLPKDRKIALFALITMHIQLVIGFVIYFVSPLGKDSFGDLKNAALRLTSLEHPLLNIVAIALITIGWSRHKKASTSEAKFKAISFFYSIGLVLILIRLPWALWFK
jgi:hypothetical protein